MKIDTIDYLYFIGAISIIMNPNGDVVDENDVMKVTCSLPSGSKVVTTLTPKYYAMREFQHFTTTDINIELVKDEIVLMCIRMKKNIANELLNNIAYSKELIIGKLQTILDLKPSHIEKLTMLLKKGKGLTITQTEEIEAVAKDLIKWSKSMTALQGLNFDDAYNVAYSKKPKRSEDLF